LEQILLDFGASRRRVDAAVERITTAEAEYDRKSDAIALRAVSAWYDLFAYGHLAELADNFIIQNGALRSAVSLRIAQGVAAEVERARIDSAIASARLRRAQYGRELDNARAQFTELFSLKPPARVARASAPRLEPLSDDALAGMAAASAPVRIDKANARAARAEAKAARADVQPVIIAGIDAGRFGLYEPGRSDYDVRMGQQAKVSLTAYDSSIYGSLRGMVADISLLGDKRSVLDYLLSPFTRLKEEAFRE
jgi:outer membrane protein, adhesin transport system